MKVDYLVEATHETEMLVYLLLKDHVKWDQNIDLIYQNRGVFLGKDNAFPNMVSLIYIGVDDKVVCFYHGASVLVDHDQIEGYMKKEYPDSEIIDASQLVFKFRKFQRLGVED